MTVINHVLFSLFVLCTVYGAGGDVFRCEIEVTLTEGTNMAVAVSPDKSRLALALQGTIWTLPFEGGRALAVTDHLGDSHEPSWSPDGERIAFHSYRSENFHIWVVDKDGENMEQITDGFFDDREPDWSPDGGSIVFSSDRSGAYELWRVELSTGDLEQLTFSEASNFNPAYSPDGSRIAFVAERRDRPGIYVLENGREKLIAASSLRLAAPSWSENGEQILFTSLSSSSGYCGIYCQVSYQKLVNIVTGSVERISSDEDLFPFRAGWLSNESFIYTADGQIKRRSIADRVIGRDAVDLIPFEARVTLNREPYERKRYDFDDKTGQPPLGLIGPVVSPDGEQVAFAALGDLYVQQIGGDLQQLTEDGYVHLDPDWSPDGRFLAYISDRGGHMQVWIRDLQSGQDRILVPGYEGEGAMPSWSPDGQRVAFYTADYRKKWGSGSLLVADVMTGNVESVHGSTFVPGKATWSPDGRNLMLMALKRHSSRFREGHNQFLIVSLDREETRFVTPDSTNSLSMRNQNGPVWSPDGNKIAYVQDGRLWVVPVTADGSIIGEAERVTDELADNISWTGDSRSLVFIATDRLKRLDLQSRQSEEISIDLRWRAAKSDQDYVIQVGRLFTGLENRYMENMDILVSGNRIAGIEPRNDNRSGMIVNATDKVVLPGLFEMHSHQSSANGEMLGKLWLSYGITSVRDPGSDPYDSLYRKESWASDVLAGPRLFFTGGLMDGRPSYGLTHSVLDPDHLLMEMDRAERLGYDFIKTYVRMPDLLQKQITLAAHQIGIPVTSHEVFPSARYNVDSIEHDRATSRRGYAHTQSDLSNTYDDVIQLLTAAGMTMTPTLAVTGGGFSKMALEYDELLNDERLRVLHSEEYMERLSSQNFNLDAQYRLSKKQESLRRLIDAGGVITAGTDSPLPFPYAASLHSELWIYVDAGLTPFQALQTATINAATAVGVSQDLGSVEVGKVADLVIVEGDPLHRIQDAMKVDTVIKNGIIYSVSELINRERKPIGIKTKSLFKPINQL